jgi:tetratricopeptide (TPR) repeat protein
MRRILAVVLLAAGSAYAGDEKDIRKTVEEALARGDRAAALAALDAVVEPGAPPDRIRCRDAANAAMDLVGGTDGHVRAVRALVGALKLDRSDRDGVYTLTMGVKRRLKDVDLVAAQELLRGLVRIYPEELGFNNELATAYRHSGLSDQALAQYEQIKDLAPSDRECRYTIAFLQEMRGTLDDAVATYDDLIGMRADDAQPELKAHWLKTQLLLGKAHDLPAARKALDAGVAAATRALPGQDRDWYLDAFNGVAAELDYQEAARATLQNLRGHLNSVLLWVSVAWVMVLGGGLATLRRAKWI